MALLEVRRNGDLIKQKVVDDLFAQKGCNIRIGSSGTIHLILGETKTVGQYQISLLENELPAEDNQTEVNSKNIDKVTEDKKHNQVQRQASNKNKRIQYPRIEGYEITGKLGQGGMGTVWRGIQLSTKREVAIKFLGQHRFLSEKAQKRFEREVSLAAKLNHPNIARIYDSGIHQGMYYYAMELVDGIHLDEYIKQNKLSVYEVLELVKYVCMAMSYAHDLGIIHRDLKPSNILVNKDGIPYVVDFGLAKETEADEKNITISVEGEIAGTPVYMAPEQAAGRISLIASYTDVYSIGVLLYKILTGRFPYDISGSRYDIMKRIVEGEPQRPSQISDVIDSELESILLTCLAKEPQDRYPSASVLLQDIDNYLMDEPLIAKSFSTTYRLKKRIAKNRTRLILFGVGIFIVCLVAISIYYNFKATDRKGQKKIAGIVEQLEQIKL